MHPNYHKNHGAGAVDDGSSRVWIKSRRQQVSPASLGWLYMCGVYGRNAFASAHKAAQANVVDLPSRREKEENTEAVRIDCVAPFCRRQRRCGSNLF